VTGAQLWKPYLPNVDVERFNSMSGMPLVNNILAGKVDLAYIFTGLSVAVGITWLRVIAAEMVASRGGLGYLTWEAYATFNYPTIFVGMTAIGILGALSSALLRCVNRRVMPWRKRFQPRDVDTPSRAA